MMLIDVVLLGLAVFSITYMIRRTDGPFDLFVKLREFVGIHHAEEYEDEVYIGVVEVVDNTFMARLFSCYWCLSLWVSLVCLLIWNILPDVILLFSIIGVAGLLNGIISYGKTN